MKTRKPIMFAVLSVLAVLLFLPVRVMAAGSIDSGRDVSLTVSCQDEDRPLTGAEFDLYLVAVVDEFGQLTTTETFRQFNVDIRGKNDDAWKDLASTLEGFVLRDGITPTDSGKTNEQGLLSFPDQAQRLEQGLYLVLGHRHTQDGRIYDTAPSMVLLPAQDKDANDWLYDVTVKPKHDSHPEPDNPDDDTVTRKVLKVWADKGHEKERPEEVVVQLLQDGKVYDTVTLNEANNWRYTWEELDNRCQWTMVEKELKGYTVTVTREGVTFVVTNTYTEDIPDEPAPTEPTSPSTEPDEPVTPPTQPGKPSKPTLPDTGQLWWPVPVLTAVGLLLIVLGLLRRRGTGYEE